jgi:hypothetical protein
MLKYRNTFKNKNKNKNARIKPHFAENKIRELGKVQKIMKMRKRKREKKKKALYELQTNMRILQMNRVQWVFSGYIAL